MYFRQYQLGCLSLLSYLIGDESTGRAVVVDPQRDISQYLGDAEEHGLRIERVIETHFHADFLSGHLELAAATGAAISYGPGARAEFAIDELGHGERLSLGEVVLEIRSTPGHTPESISVVVWEHADDAAPYGVLTGDTLFIGDVGRPDLLGSVGKSADSLARQLYHSVHDQLLTLPDGTRVFPAHSAGSACGKHMSTATTSTIGEQRATNYALVAPDEDSFVGSVVEGQSLAPLYFEHAAAANRSRHGLLDDHEPPAPLGLGEVLALQRAGAVVLDTRPPEVFASGHLRDSVNVGLEGRFAEYAGDVLRAGDAIVLAGDAGSETEAKVRLARIGYDRVAGYLPDLELELFRNPGLAVTAARLPATDLASWREEDPSLQLVDVRNPSEHEAGVIGGARLIPLPQLLDRFTELEPAATTVVYCARGSRSSIAASVLRARRFTRVADVIGGCEGWRAAGLPLVAATLGASPR
jgi:hydroxyacylglutathione hydrolase